jgi:hypothetical protein
VRSAKPRRYCWNGQPAQPFRGPTQQTDSADAYQSLATKQTAER